jgi:AcrR family transcriptional regulator
VEVRCDLASGQGAEVHERYDDRLSDDTADLDHRILGNARRRKVETHAEARKRGDAMLSGWERTVLRLHGSPRGRIHTGTYGYASPTSRSVHTLPYAKVDTVATARTARSRWVEEGLRALGAGGPDNIRIETIARRLGVTKGGFYWHFDDRSALLEDVLDAWERLLLDEVIERVEARGGDARAKLRRLFAMASDEAVTIDLAVRDWARYEPAVADRLRHVDNRRMDYMRSLFGTFCTDDDDVEVRCVLAFSLWIGNHFMAADHAARSRAQVTRLALRRLLAATTM